MAAGHAVLTALPRGLEERLRRRHLLVLAGLAPAACGLPPNTALRDWARTAAVAADGAVPADLARDEVLARQAALSGWLRALAILAEEEGMPTFRPATSMADDPAIAALTEALRSASNTPPNRGPAAGADAQDEARRLPVAIRAADPAVQALAVALSAALDGEAQADARRAITAIAATHAMLAARARHLRQEALRREVREAEDGLRRLMPRLPPGTALARRPQGATLAP